MKNIYKIGLLIFGLISFSVSSAETCDEQYHGYPFDIVTIDKEPDQHLTCYYQCQWPCIKNDNYYIKPGRYVPKEGPWFESGGGCRAKIAADCHFERITKSI